MPSAAAEELRARFLDLAPEGFEEIECGADVELAGYGPAAERIIGVFPGARVVEVEDGWEDRWREFHHGVHLGPLWVGPPWEPAPADALPVVIDPGQAFGTGAHATTRLCLELLLERPRGSLLDLGCGSGVLAIAAVKLGFAPVLAVDVDPIAVEVTRQNALANGVEIEVRELDARAAELPTSDVVVANISLEDVQSLTGRLPSGSAITSGYLVGSTPGLPGFERVERRELDGWAGDLFERR